MFIVVLVLEFIMCIIFMVGISLVISCVIFIFILVGVLKFKLCLVVLIMVLWIVGWLWFSIIGF